MDYNKEISDLRGIGGVIEGATALVMGIAARVEAAVEAFAAANPNADTSPLDAEVSALRTQADALAAAVAQNTPQAPSDGGTIQPGQDAQQSDGAGSGEGDQPSGGAEAKTE